MKRSVLFSLGIGMLTLAGSGAAYCLQHAEPAAAPVAVAAAKAEVLPLQGDWHSVDNYLQLQRVAESDDAAAGQAAQRDARQADLRRRLQPPLLPLELVADASAKLSPKSHWGDGAKAYADYAGGAPGATAAATTGATTGATTAATIAPAPGAGTSATAAPNGRSLVSDHARETVAMLEAFKTALRETGGDKKFPLRPEAAAPYLDR